MSIVNIDIFTIYIFLIFTQAFDFKDVLPTFLMAAPAKVHFCELFSKKFTSQTYAWRPPSSPHRA